MNLYELFILGINIKYIPFSILYRHINCAHGIQRNMGCYVFLYKFNKSVLIVSELV